MSHHITHSKVYEQWAPVVGRVLLAVPFAAGALFKIPTTAGFTMEAGMTAQAGVPLPEVAVFLGFVIEVIAALALVLGWQTRPTAFLLVLYTILLTAIFHHDFSTPQAIGAIITHVYLIGGLLYLSVYGARYIAVSKDPVSQS